MCEIRTSTHLVGILCLHGVPGFLFAKIHKKIQRIETIDLPVT